MALPRATDRKNNATIWVWKLFGASFVVSDSPTGDSSNSAKVNSNRMPTRPSSGALLAPPPAIGMKPGTRYP